MVTPHSQSSFSRVGLPSTVGFAGRRRAPHPTLILVLATCSRSTLHTPGAKSGKPSETASSPYNHEFLQHVASLHGATGSSQTAESSCNIPNTPKALEKAKWHPSHYSSTLNGHGSTHGNICVLLFAPHTIFMSPSSHTQLPPVCIHFHTH